MKATKYATPETKLWTFCRAFAVIMSRNTLCALSGWLRLSERHGQRPERLIGKPLRKIYCRVRLLLLFFAGFREMRANLFEKTDVLG